GAGGRGRRAPPAGAGGGRRREAPSPARWEPPVSRPGRAAGENAHPKRGWRPAPRGAEPRAVGAARESSRARGGRERPPQTRVEAGAERRRAWPTGVWGHRSSAAPEGREQRTGPQNLLTPAKLVVT